MARGAMETVKHPSPSAYPEMYAERNSRLHCQGPASDRTHRFSGWDRMEMRSHRDRTASRISRYGVNFSTEEKRLPTGLPFRCYDVLEASHTRRASPLLAGLSAGITPDAGNSITRQGISLIVLFGPVLCGQFERKWHFL